MIERVEIVRGGGSSLYGSSAVAGTVNIVTRVPRGKQFFFAKQFSMTNFQAPEINLSGGKSFENNEGTFGAVIYANYRNRSAWDANGDEFSEITKIKAKSAGYKAFLKFSERKRLDFQGYVMQEYRRGGDVTNRKPHETPLAEELLHKIYNSGVSFEMMSNDKKSKFSIYNTTQFIRRDSYYGSGQIDAYGLTDDLTSTSGMQFSQFLSKFLGGESVLTAGAEANINRLNDHILAVGRSLMQRANFFAIYVQNDWTISERLKLLTGGRIDRQNLLQKAVFCPRVSLLYNAGENLQFRTGYARGFRAPQVFNEDLHISQAGGVLLRIVNSEKLKPEFSDSFTFSGDYLRQEENFAFGITADFFCTRLKNVFTLNESGRDDFGNLLLIKQNGSGARVFGVSLNPKLVFKNAFEMQSGLTFQRSLHDEKIYWSATATAVRKFLRTPDLYGFYTLTSNFSKKITVSLSGVLTGRMYVPHFKGYIENDVLKKTPAFFEQNFKVSRAFRGNNSTFELFTGLQNAFNSYQKDFDLGAERDAGYLYGASRPRVFFVGMRADF
jgi:outer membrane receptor for ferrienterochelin and colicins